MLHKLTVGGAGALNQTGGTVTVGGDLNLSWYGGHGILNQSGGTLTHNNGALIVGTSAGTGLINLSGTASHTENGTAANAVQLGSAGTALGILNISDSATFNVPSSNIVVGLSSVATDTSVGVMNLMGGTVSALSISSSGGSSTGYVNFNGGTLSPAASSTTFMQGIASTTSGLGGAFVYSGNAIINTNGYDITIAEPLKAPTGNGVSATGLTVSGGGYIYAPVVSITNATGDTNGNGATAVATIDSNGNLTGIVVTNPGVGYTAPPTFTLVGGGLGNTGAIAGAADLGPEHQRRTDQIRLRHVDPERYKHLHGCDGNQRRLS